MNPRGAQGPVYVRVLRAFLSVGLILAITYVGFRLVPVNATTIGFVYLIAIVAMASAFGMPESITASVAAVLNLNYYFLPPVGTFTIEDPANWVALVAFLLTSIMISHLSVRVQREAATAIRGKAEMQNLYSFSRAILLSNPNEPVASQAAQQLALVFDCPGTALFDAASNEIYYGGPEHLDSYAETLRQTALKGATERDEFATVFAVNLGGKPIGSVVAKGLDLSDPALESLANLIAIGLEKARSEQATTRAEAARQSDELKSALMDAIAHEFKTPLTSIKAAASGLFAPSTIEAQKELASIVDEETDRLNDLVSEAIHMSRLDAGKVKLERALTAPDAAVRAALRQLASRAADREVTVKVAEGLSPIEQDVGLLAIAMRQILDNAIKYSPAGKPIHVEVTGKDDAIQIEVRDQGPGIPPKDLDLIFDRFYRSRGTRKQAPGSGLGLAIARQILELHGGEIRVENRTDPPGSAFIASIPYQLEKTQ